MTTREDAPTDESRSLAFVVLAYRGAMAELSGTDARYRATVWEALEAVTPGEQTETLFGLFYGFARALLAQAGRPLAWRKTCCAHLCRDEWLAVSMIDAAQRADHASLLAATTQLVGEAGVGDALDAAQTLAAALCRCGFYLRPQAAPQICDLCPARTLH